MSKTALAPSISQATPKVEIFIESVKSHLGSSAIIEKFYVCEPPITDVEDFQGHNHWVEGNWGAHILVGITDLSTIMDILKLSKTIDIDEITIKPRDETKIELSLWLSAKLLRG